MRQLSTPLALTLMLAGSASLRAEPPARPDAARRLALPITQSPIGPGPLLPRRPDERPDRTVNATGAATLEEAIDRCVQTDMAARNTPGASVAVMLGGQLIYQRGYGVKHRRNGGVVDAQTVFRIGSVTKQLTAAAVLQQAERGAVDLQAPVTTYVPELSLAGLWPATSITVHHLLTHASGYPDNWGELSGPTDDGALSAWVATQSQTRLHAPPGSFYNYSNPNYILAGLVAERAGGVPFRAYTESNIFAAAGMTATTFDPQRVLATGNYAWGHYTNPLNGREIVYLPSGYDSGAPTPAGYAFSTAGDLVRWADLLMEGGGAVLSTASAATIQAPHAYMDYTPDMFYGYGIFVESYKGLDVRQHGGAIPGWGAMLLWVGEQNFALAVLNNTFGPLGTAPYCIVDAVLQPEDVPAPDLSTDQATWRRYVGTYDVTDSLGDTLTAQVFFRGDELMITFSNFTRPQPPYTTELVQAFLDTFVIDGNDDGELDTDVTFIRSGTSPGKTFWARNRSLVGALRSLPRRRLTAAASPP